MDELYSGRTLITLNPSTSHSHYLRLNYPCNWVSIIGMEARNVSGFSAGSLVGKVIGSYKVGRCMQMVGSYYTANQRVMVVMTGI